jgi:predicted secreted Zn-dependent protease
VSVTEERAVMNREGTDKRIDDLTGRVGRFEESVKERFDRVDDRFDRFEGDVKDRFDRFEGAVKDRFDRFEGDVKVNFAKVDARFDKADARFDKAEAGSEELGKKIDKMTRVLISGLVTVVGAVVIKVFIS